MRQHIRFCSTDDGVRLAYATSGEGPPLVKAANYLTHLEHDWDGPVWQHWLRSLAQHHRLIRYDERGSGLSDRDVADFSVDAWVGDLERVVDTLELDRFSLLGISQGASVSVAYAVRHPERVSRLVLYGGYARGRLRRELTEEERLQAQTMINVIRSGWGLENPAFRQLFTTMLMPDASEPQMEALNRLAEVSASPETAARMEAAFYEIDVTAIAPMVTVPTLVMHVTEDAAIPFEEGRLLAGLIPGARFVPLEGRNHILVEGEAAWHHFLTELYGFLEEDAGGSVRPEPGVRSHPGFAELTKREREVLALIGTGADNAEISHRLFIADKTTRNHISRIYTKLGIGSRARAVVLAREAGLDPPGP